MIQPREFSPNQAVMIGNAIGIDWNTVDLEQFRMGLSVELEHGARDPQTNVTNDDLIATGMIALAHLKELPDYYTRLAMMESGAELDSAAGYPMAAHPAPVRAFRDAPGASVPSTIRRYPVRQASPSVVRELSFWTGTIAGSGLVLLVKWALSKRS